MLSEVEQEQRPSGNGDREAIVVGAGLCDGEGERAYTEYAPTLEEESTENLLPKRLSPAVKTFRHQRRFGNKKLPKRLPPSCCRNVLCRNVRNPNVGCGAKSWAARRQTGVATSTTEAELHALSEAVKEAVHLRGILDTLGESIATTLFTDSQSCLALATRDDNSSKTKHFATRMAYVRETVKNQSIDLKFIASGDNCADIFTKGLGKTKTQQHLARLSAMRGIKV